MVHFAIVHGRVAEGCLRYLNMANMIAHQLQIVTQIAVQLLTVERVVHDLQIGLLQLLHQLQCQIVRAKIVVGTRGERLNANGNILLGQVASPENQELFDLSPGEKEKKLKSE